MLSFEKKRSRTMWIQRYCEDLGGYLEPNKVLVILGPRRSGKTSLIERFLTNCTERYRYLIGDSLQAREALSQRDVQRLRDFLEGINILAIDEAQYIPYIGHTLKLIVDLKLGVKIIASGSSSFDLSGQVGEPLTGRKTTLLLLPISQRELLSLFSPYDLKQQLPLYLIYGSYPEVVTSETNEKRKRYLLDLVNSLLLKDIFAFERLKSPRVIVDLLRILAYQIGNLISYNEIASMLGIDQKTVVRYIDLLEKSYVVFRLEGFSNNLRDEIKKKQKIYFYDLGVRNAVIENFSPIEVRADVGQLWENFVVSEILKREIEDNPFVRLRFWQRYSGQEIDIVLEKEGKLFLYGAKWNAKKARSQPPKAWQEAYANWVYTPVTPENYLAVLREKI